LSRGQVVGGQVENGELSRDKLSGDKLSGDKLPLSPLFIFIQHNESRQRK
jgi:hypothetical protein